MGLAISLRHNFVFIHVPKTAGDSIWQVLQQGGFNDIWPPEEGQQTGLEALWDLSLRTSSIMLRAIEAGHWRYVDLVPVLGQVWVDKQRIFAVVRNPWDRAVSAYLYDVRTKPQALPASTTFAGWLQYMKRTCQADPELALLYSQHTYILDAAGRLPRNLRVLYFEALPDDFVRMCKEAGLAVPTGAPPLDLTKFHVNQSIGRRPYQEYYTPELRACVDQLFQRDIDLLGYTF